MRILAALLLSALTIASTQGRALSVRDQEQLVEDYFALEGKTAGGRAGQLEILGQLASVPAPNPSTAKRWRKRFEKMFDKGRKFEKATGGQRYWWEDEKRGLFIVGGKTKRPKGLFIGMHGGGVGSGDATSSAGAYAGPINQFDWVGIFPEVLEKTERGWTDSGTEEWVLELVDAARRTWDIDPNHVFFGGHSMGGYGSWVLGAHHADRVAALAPSAGAPSFVMNQDGSVYSIQDGVVPNLRNVPMTVFQSVDDPRVPPDVNQFAAAEIEKARDRWGGYEHFDYWEVDGFGHGYPDGGPGAILERVAEYERDPHPDRIVWQPSLSWKRQFYWLYWEEPVEGALVIADLDRAANSISIESEDEVNGLSILLSDSIVDMKKEVTLTLNGQQVFKAVPERSLEAMVLTGVWGDPGLYYEARVPLL